MSVFHSSQPYMSNRLVGATVRLRDFIFQRMVRFSSAVIEISFDALSANFVLRALDSLNLFSFKQHFRNNKNHFAWDYIDTPFSIFTLVIIFLLQLINRKLQRASSAALVGVSRNNLTRQIQRHQNAAEAIAPIS